MTSARPNDLRRRLRKRAVKAVRRSRLLPSTFPDRLGQDDELEGATLNATVLVYFSDTRESLYQLRPWYQPLRKLHERHRVVLVFQDSRTAAVVHEELGLPVLTIARYGTLDGLLARSDVKLALYVNNSPQNFSCLRFTSLVHVYLAHGDSDKGVSVSNQHKAYDFNFVAGQAAVDRLAAVLLFTDVTAWCRLIGRPQLDFAPVGKGGSETPDHPTVLYAPTWEGAQPSLAYGSLVSHGRELVQRLLDSGQVRVAYRPHPLSGVTSAEYGAADADVRAMLRSAASADPKAGHLIDVERSIEACFADADLLLCDVSAVAMDWLPSGKPLIITEPEGRDVITASTRMLDVVPRLPVADVPHVVDLVRAEVAEDPTRSLRLELIEYYLGDVTPGAATQRFLDECSKVIAERDQAVAALRSRASTESKPGAAR